MPVLTEHDGLLKGGVSGITLALSPDAYWRLSDVGFGTAEDISGNGYNGTITGTPGIVQPGAIAGDTGAASSYIRGNPDYIAVTTMGSFGSSMATCSASCWVRTSNTSDIMHIFGATNTAGGDGTNWRLLLNADQNGTLSSGKVECLLRASNSKRLRGATSSATSVNNGGWHHVALVCVASTNTLTFYVDGTAQSTSYKFQETAATFNNLNPAMELGRQNNGANPYTGDLAEVAMWTRALTQQEISLLSAQGIN